MDFDATKITAAIGKAGRATGEFDLAAPVEGQEMVTSETIGEALREVMDPEIQMNVVDLGLIKEIAVAEDRVSVRMVLTAPGCPLAGYLVSQVRARVGQVAEGRQVEVHLLNEPWTPPWPSRA